MALSREADKDAKTAQHAAWQKSVEVRLKVQDARPKILVAGSVGVLNGRLLGTSRGFKTYPIMGDIQTLLETIHRLEPWLCQETALFIVMFRTVTPLGDYRSWAEDLRPKVVLDEQCHASRPSGS